MVHIRIEDLEHIYKSPAGEARRVLDIPSWIVEPGDQILLRGVSGSGKTTLFNIIAGLMRPTAGDVFYGKKSLYSLSESDRDRFRAGQVGYVFQQHYLVDSLTALENVIMPMHFGGNIPRNQHRDRAHTLLDQLQLGDYTSYMPHQLSTGQRLRVAIARALANHPAILLADEPTAALDPGNATGVVELLQRTCAANGASLIVASHDPALTDYFEIVADLRGGSLDTYIEEIA